MELFYSLLVSAEHSTSDEIKLQVSTTSSFEDSNHIAVDSNGIKGKEHVADDSDTSCKGRALLNSFLK